MKSYTQKVFTFTNGKRFVVKDNTTSVWNGERYVSKGEARKQFRNLLTTGLTYSTDTRVIYENDQAPRTFAWAGPTMWGYQ